MKKYLRYGLFAISATFSMVTSVQAEEVSTKAADLMMTSTVSEVNNQEKVAQQNNFSGMSVAQTFEAKSSDQNYWYLSGSVGLGFPGDLDLEDKSSGIESSIGLNTGFQGSVAVGYQFDKARAELELSHSSNGVDDVEISGVKTSADGHVKTTALFVNGYYDIPTKSKWVPYVGAGIGIGFPRSAEVDNESETLGSSAFAFQAKAGVQRKVAKKGNVFAEAKFQHVGGTDDTIDGTEVDISSTNNFSINVGYRHGF